MRFVLVREPIVAIILTSLMQRKSSFLAEPMQDGTVVCDGCPVLVCSVAKTPCDNVKHKSLLPHKHSEWLLNLLEIANQPTPTNEQTVVLPQLELRNQFTAQNVFAGNQFAATRNARQ